MDPVFHLESYFEESPLSNYESAPLENCSSWYLARSDWAGQKLPYSEAIDSD